MWHRFQAFFRWAVTYTESRLEFKQSSLTRSGRAIRLPCSTTPSSMRRFSNMLLFRLAFAIGLVGSSRTSPSFPLSVTGISQSASWRTPYVPVSRHTAPQSFSSYHEHHSVGKPVLTPDMPLRFVSPCDVLPRLRRVVDRGNADEEYSCYRGCSFPLNREGCDGRPPRYLHP